MKIAIAGTGNVGLSNAVLLEGCRRNSVICTAFHHRLGDGDICTGQLSTRDGDGE